ncbi:helix-turn-helix domain-containing protein, partial [Streptomyces sp. NPDC001177]
MSISGTLFRRWATSALTRRKFRQDRIELGQGLAQLRSQRAGIDHETNRRWILGVQLRYNYRAYPDASQRRALASAFGCARV